ncbi:hypothetical protein [Mesorhizobium sp.]|uniref:hypothetical protein n=1 Tax=Mesorhizobium sp. TaxID=1871066 RepID=UPI003BAA44DD
MVHVIPLSVGQRRLDTGNAPQYPQGSPIGGAMQGFGDQLSAVAERYQQMKDQQEAFDAELKRRAFNGRVARVEDEVAANAAPDGAGLHDAMYSAQVDPRSGKVVKPSLFDILFDEALPNMPESQRSAFVDQKGALYAAGARRMAQRQLQRRQDYEQAQVDTALQASAIAIAQGDPDDSTAFEAQRQDGLDLIAKIGADAQTKLQVMTDWLGATAKARLQALIAKDPKRAAELLSAEQAGASAGHAVGAAAAVGSANVFAKGPTNILKDASANNASQQAKGVANDRDASPLAVRGDAVAPDEKGAPVSSWLADLSPDTANALHMQARVATAGKLINGRANIDLAVHNAPAAIADTGSYSGAMPGPADFAAIYGAEDGGKRFQEFNRKIDIGQQTFNMRFSSNQGIQAALRDAEPGPGSSQEDQSRYQVAATTALRVLTTRRADPAGYVRKVFPSVDAAWNKVIESGGSDPSAYGEAIATSVAAQKQLGIENLQPLPQAIAQNIAETLNSKDVSQGDKNVLLHRLRSGVTGSGVRAALFQQLSQARVSMPAQIDPITTAAMGETAREAEQELAPVPLGQEDFDKRARPFLQDEGARQKSKEVTFAAVVSREGVRDKLIFPPGMKRDVNGILQSAVIDESKLAFNPNGPGQWGAFFGDPIGAVYGKIASSRAESTKGWNNEGDAKARELAEALKDTDLTPNDIADLAFRFGYLQIEPVHTRKK